ncbi:MAG: hypothetical protein U0271_22000 [Polyangiaceae bacterium]
MTPFGFTAFQIACAVVVVATLATMARQRPPRVLLAEYASLAIAGFLGEETCIAGYAYYAYAPGWAARLHHVPLLVPMIWPLVILSARDVVRALYPGLDGVRRAAAIAVAVTFDAVLIEVLSVRAGLWSWAEPGLLGVPGAGLLGWGFFTLGAAWALDHFKGPLARLVAVVAVAPLVTHALILASWWGALRWWPRVDWGTAGLLAEVAFAAALTGFVVVARRRGRAVGPDVWGPRAVATSVFVVLYWVVARDQFAHGVVLAATSVPHLATLAWRPALSPVDVVR